MKFLTDIISMIAVINVFIIYSSINVGKIMKMKHNNQKKSVHFVHP